MHKFTKALAAIGLAAVMSQSAIAESMKLGFLVKQPEEPWFQTEWKFADKAGKDQLINPQKLKTYFAGFGQLTKRRKYSSVKTSVMINSSQTKICHSSYVR